MRRRHTIPRRTTGKNNYARTNINDSGYLTVTRSDIPVHPYGKDYDPIAAAISSGRAVNAADAVKEGLKNFCLQEPNPPSKKVAKVFSMTINDHKRFYLLNIPDNKISTVTNYIQKLGGSVDNGLESATNVIFYPTEKLLRKETFFTFLTAAVSGRLLLPVSYVVQSYDEKKFLNVFEYSKLEYIDSKYDLDDNIRAAIKMSICHRKLYAKKRLPPYYGQKILFAVEKGQHEDVKLLLHFLGAYVQPYYSDWMTDKTFHCCVADGTVKVYMPYEIPIVRPDDVRKILWDFYQQFLS